MHLEKSSLIGLDGAVARLEASHDIRSYAIALSQYYALLKLRSQLQQRSKKETGHKEATTPMLKK